MREFLREGRVRLLEATTRARGRDIPGERVAKVTPGGGPGADREGRRSRRYGERDNGAMVTPVPLHFGALHAYEQVLVLLLAFGPFVVLGVVVAIQRRRAISEEDRADRD
jgi:hypothetical protein